MTTVFSFTCGGRQYRIVPTGDWDWRRRLGYRPRTPYVLVNEDGSSTQGVSESDLAWYRARYAAGDPLEA